ncbi:MAG: DUF2167 domain-containing protein [Luteolibacter sp.]
MKYFSRSLILGSALVFAAATPLLSQDESASDQDMSGMTEQDVAEMKEYMEFMNSISWVTEGKGQLGSRAEIEVPEGYQYTASAGTIKLMELYGNLTSGAELGYISPLDMDWFAVFEFEDIGYVKDDEKDKLDADEILDSLKEGQKQANAELSRLGMSTLTVVGWHTPPFYNTETNNLEWAIKLATSDGEEILNYKTKILGRKGVMDVVLVCSEEQLATVVPEYQMLIAGFTYKESEKYSSFTKGDKIAEYGLVGLIAGGGLLVAAKSGLLAKLWKPIAVGLVAVGAFVKRIFKGKNADSI